MTLHIFNPDHDLALAADMRTFTAPHAARQLRYDLGFLPSIWAKDGDTILTKSKEYAIREYKKICSSASKIGVNLERDVFFVEPNDVYELNISDIQPWGWNKTLAYRLSQMGVKEHLLPTEKKLTEIRAMSHRQTAAQLLPDLRVIENTAGESFFCKTLEEVELMMVKYKNIVVKAPWSSSGRGLRFGIGELTDHQRGWIKNIIIKQGAVAVEPFYKKLKDFGMEFEILENGSIAYCGLSLFDTHNGAYTGNLIATEEAKRLYLSKYLNIRTVDNTREMICQKLPGLLKGYSGPVGIDMLILPERKLHPCVEINLRRTMGHVALNFSPYIDDIIRIMRIEMINNIYKLKIKQL